jgi:type IV secretion system protein VirD4
MQIIEQIFTTIINLLEGLFELLARLVSGGKNKGYNASFTSASVVLSSWNKGFNTNGRKKLSLKYSYQNFLACGGPGTGKSSVILLPTLYTTQGSFIVNDPSGELYQKSSNYLKQRGYTVKVLNFSNHRKSANYNPLERANTSSEIQKISSLLVENSLGGNKADKFWNTLSVNLISILISILRTQNSEYQNPANVLHLLNALAGDPKSIDKLFSDHASLSLFSEYKAFISQDDKVTSGIISTCKAALQIFSNEEVALVTAHDELDFSQFRKTPTALFIQTSVSEQKYFSPIVSILFEQFFSYLLSRFPEKEEQDIFLLIDEASSLTLKTLPIATFNCRKHRAGIMILLQSYSQLQNQYSKENAEAIRASCYTQMYFSGQPMETCRELSEIMGKYQYEDEKKHTVVRPLMTPDEIRKISNKEALLVCGNLSVIKAKLHPYYRQYRFKQYSELPPLELNADPGHLSLLPLNHLSEQADKQPQTYEQKEQ